MKRYRLSSLDQLGFRGKEASNKLPTPSTRDVRRRLIHWPEIADSNQNDDKAAEIPPGPRARMTSNLSPLGRFASSVDTRRILAGFLWCMTSKNSRYFTVTFFYAGVLRDFDRDLQLFRADGAESPQAKIDFELTLSRIDLFQTAQREVRADTAYRNPQPSKCLWTGFSKFTG
jgi:hypothetical protein